MINFFARFLSNIFLIVLSYLVQIYKISLIKERINQVFSFIRETFIGFVSLIGEMIGILSPTIYVEPY